MATIEIALQQNRAIEPQAVRSLYDTAGWWPERQEKQIAQVLNRDLAIGAWDEGHLIGFARIISDSAFHAYIEDVVIHPAYQRKGIGKLLLEQLIEAVSEDEMLSLFCKSELLPFYEELGFQIFPSQIVMHRKRTRSS